MISREKIDIEALIVRAYREKAVHRLRGSGAIALGLSGPKVPGGGFSTAEKVDTSSFSARAAARTRELQMRLAAAPDALLDLHDAVLGLPDFYIERGPGLDFVVWDVETAARAGHRIEVDDANGASIVQVQRRGGRGPHRDTLLPVGAPRRLTALVTSTIVLLNGQHGDRPFVPEVVVERMRPIYDGDRHDVPARYVPVYETGLQEIVEARATYAVWFAALGMLCAALAGLAEVEVTGPAAPAEPWAPPSRVKRGRRVSGLRDAADAHVLALRAMPADAHVLAFRAIPKTRPAKRPAKPRAKAEKLIPAMA